MLRANRPDQRLRGVDGESEQADWPRGASRHTDEIQSARNSSGREQRSTDGRHGRHGHPLGHRRDRSLSARGGWRGEDFAVMLGGAHGDVVAKWGM